jgi:hypothetical protein
VVSRVNSLLNLLTTTKKNNQFAPLIRSTNSSFIKSSKYWSSQLEACWSNYLHMNSPPNGNKRLRLHGENCHPRIHQHDLGQNLIGLSNGIVNRELNVELWRPKSIWL